MADKPKCVILAAGPVSGYADFKKVIQPEDYVICADNGFRHARAMGIIPDLLVGDFDSCTEPEMDLRTIVHPAQKDETDTYLALEEGIKAGYRSFFILGGLGGRLDHTFANIALVAHYAKKGIKISVADEQTRIYAVTPGLPLRLEQQENVYVSVFSFTERSLGVNYYGLKYPLQDAVLFEDFPLGVSNEFSASFAEITVKKGVLLVMTVKK